jgi:hypothetical protein
VRRTASATTSAGMKSMLVPYPVSLQNLEMRTDGKVTGASLGIGGEFVVEREF